MTSLQEDIRYRIMRILEEKPDITQRELAKELGVSLGGVNFCLKAMMERGWVKAQNFGHSSNKLGYAYLLTPSGLIEKAELTTRFLKRKMREYEVLKAEIEELEAEVFKISEPESGLGEEERA